MGEADLIPALPDDVAMQVLLRVPPCSYPQLQQVSPRWRELVLSPQFYQERKREGTIEKLLCMVQTMEPPLAKPAVKPSPVFGITILNLARKSWERLPPIPDFPDCLPIFCRMVVTDGKLIVLGGWNPVTYETLQTVYVFNFVTQSWSRGASMSTSRSFFACAAMEKLVFVAGGHDNSKTALKSAEVYNVETDQWTSLSPMNEERDESTGLCIDGSFYVLSGYSSNAQGQFAESGEVYNPVTNSWTVMEGMRPPGPVAVMQGRLYSVQAQNLLSFANGTWTIVEAIPDSEVNPVCLTAVDDALIVSGPSRSFDGLGFGTFLYKPRCANGWESIPRQAGFTGVAQSSHVIEI